MRIKTFPCLLALLATGHLSAAVATVDVFNEEAPVLDFDGVTALSAGTAADNDGALIQVGYLAGVDAGLDPASFGTSEWGAFTPISGGGINSLFTSVGDQGSGGTGAFGLFVFSTGGISDTATNMAGAAGRRLAIRFYNGTSVAASTHYNTISGSQVLSGSVDEWHVLFDAGSPAAPASTSVLSLSGAGTLTGSGATFVWENNSTPFQTSLLVPEPSVPLLGLLAMAVFFRRKR